MNIKILIVIFTVFLCNCQSDKKETGSVVVDTFQEEPIKPYANPAMIYGSSFGNIFQSFYRNNKYDLMISFTSYESIKRYGREKLLDYFKHRINFDYTLGNLSNITTENKYVILTYSKASAFATRKKVTIYCIVENDSVKLVLKNLNKTPFE